MSKRKKPTEGATTDIERTLANLEEVQVLSPVAVRDGETMVRFDALVVARSGIIAIARGRPAELERNLDALLRRLDRVEPIRLRFGFSTSWTAQKHAVLTLVSPDLDATQEDGPGETDFVTMSGLRREVEARLARWTREIASSFSLTPCFVESAVRERVADSLRAPAEA